MKTDVVVQVETNDCDELRKVLVHLEGKCSGGGSRRWLYRGQSDSAWPLATTFERYARSYKLDPKHYAKQEQYTLHSFRRQAHVHLHPLPAEDDQLGILALIQHYGGPTRLLDVTRSFWVAAFFAVEKEPADPACIWAFDSEALHRPKSKGGLKKGEHEDLAKYEAARKRGEEWLKPSCDSCDSTDGAILVVQPLQLNDRLIAQQGLSLLPRKLEDGFGANLCRQLGILGSSGRCKQKETRNLNCRCPCVFCQPPNKTIDLRKKLHAKVVKIILTGELQETLRRELRKMNVVPSTLFPGLEGLARDQIWALDPETTPPPGRGSKGGVRRAGK